MKSERKTSTYYLDVFQILCHKLVHSKCHVSIFWSAVLKPIIFSLYFLFNFIQFQKKMTPWMQNRKKKPLPILAKIKCTFTNFSTSQNTCMHIQAIWLLFFLKFILKQKPASMINLHVTLTFMIDKIWKKNDFCKWKDFSSKEYTCSTLIFVQDDKTSILLQPIKAFGRLFP